VLLGRQSGRPTSQKTIIIPKYFAMIWLEGYCREKYAILDGGMAFVALPGIDTASAQVPLPRPKPRVELSMEGANPSISVKIKNWTRARWKAAKKR
jgi:hypothetical protein